MQSQNWGEVSSTAHMIRGSVMTFSGMELGQAAGRFEEAYKQDDQAEMETAFSLMVEAFQRFQAAAEEYLQK
jgi:HPt (histidine-containing phosphotransfer) domain-containing protein